PAGLMPQRAAITPKGRLYLTYANGAGPHPQSESEPMNAGALWEYNTVGGAWTNVTPAGRTHPFGGVSVDPANPKHLIASSANTYWTQSTQPGTTYGDRIYTSLDAGRTWTDLMGGAGITVDANGVDWVHQSMIHWAGSIEFDPFDAKSAWVVSGNGVYKSSNVDAPNSVWKFDVHGMEETGVYAAESIPGGPLATVIGDYDGFIQDDPSQYGPRHNPAMGSTTGLAVAPLATHVMARVGNELYTSTNTGASWEKAPSKMAARGNVALSADGFVLLHSPENSAVTYRSTDAGGSWTAVAGLSVNNARPIADGVNPAKFYVYDRDTGKVMVSTDAGVSFSAQAVLGAGGSTFLRAAPGREGDLWVCLNGRGLNHSTDSGATFTKVAGVATCSGVGLGKAAPDASYPTLYLWGTVGTARGLLRSTDIGASWVRVNDDAHQYGGMGYVVGDMNTYGTVYTSTNGRGVAYGKIDPSGDVQVVPQVYVPPPKPAECKYVVTNIWRGGGFAVVNITNTSTSVINGWTVNWTYADDTTVGDTAYNGVVTGTAPHYSANDGGGWNRDINPGQTASVGFSFGQGTPDPLPAPAVTGDICK
ncbi:MAG TPA: cellulose binding domain-containing protein, partial [Duganella sp.]|nr:cellulose binding domain-containing protein [Duganella sp.]